MSPHKRSLSNVRYCSYFEKFLGLSITYRAAVVNEQCSSVIDTEKSINNTTAKLSVPVEFRTLGNRHTFSSFCENAYMIDFQIGFLTFIGLGDEEGKPKFGLTIKPNVKKYHTIQNAKMNCKTYDLEKLGEKHILSKLLGQNDSNIIHNSMVSLSQEKSAVKLNINKL